MRLRYAPRAHTCAAQYGSGDVRCSPDSFDEPFARASWLGRETDIPGVRVFPTARYPYLVYHRVREDELVIIHVRDGRRDATKGREL